MPACRDEAQTPENEEAAAPEAFSARPSRSYGRSMAKAMVYFKDGNFSGFCEALAVGSLQDQSISVTLAKPEEPDCPLIGVSKGFQLLTGYARDEVLGRNCRFLNRGCVMPQEDRLRLRACARTGKSFAGLLQNRRKSGEVFSNFVCIDTLRVGSVFYLLGFQVDMSHESCEHELGEQSGQSALQRGVQESVQEVREKLQKELDTIVSTILRAQDDVMSRLQVLEDFDYKAWLLQKEYGHAHSCFASLETHSNNVLTTKNTFLEVQGEDDVEEGPLRRAVSDSILEVDVEGGVAGAGSTCSDAEAFSKTLKVLKDQADWLQHKAAKLGQAPEAQPEAVQPEALPAEEPVQPEPLPSAGSKLHPNGCTPCSFHCYSLRGCDQGEACQYCHAEHLRRPKPKKRGKKNQKHPEEEVAL